MATKEQIAKYREIYESAKRAGDPHPEVVAAQWAVESGWGKSTSGKNNYFGIKAGKNEAGTRRKTREVINGKEIYINDRFKDYASLDESVADRVRFTQANPRYKKSGYFSATSPAEAAMALQRSGYATDPNYADTLIKVMKSAGFNPSEGQIYDYSTTKPNQDTAFHNAQSTSSTPVAESNPQIRLLSIGDQLAQQFAPAQMNSGIESYFNQANGELEPTQQSQPSNREKYQAQLASAFGIQPEVKDGLPDYIGDLVKSIYDQV